MARNVICAFVVYIYINFAYLLHPTITMDLSPRQPVSDTNSLGESAESDDRFLHKHERRANIAGAAYGIVSRVASFWRNQAPEKTVSFLPIGVEKPPAVLELRNSQLAEALQSKLEFSEAELRAFGIDYMPPDLCIEVDGIYHRIDQSDTVSAEVSEKEYESDSEGESNALQTKDSLSVQPSAVKVASKTAFKNKHKYFRKKHKTIAPFKQNKDKANDNGQVDTVPATPQTPAAVQVQPVFPGAPTQPPPVLQSHPGQIGRKINNIEQEINSIKDSVQKQQEVIASEKNHASNIIDKQSQEIERITKTIHDNTADIADAIRRGISGAVKDQREEARRLTQAQILQPQSQSEMIAGLDKTILSSIAQAARPGKRATETDIRLSALALNVTSAFAVQMKYDYIKTFRCENTGSEIISIQDNGRHLKEILCAFRLLEMCMKTQWTRVSTQKRVEMDFIASVKQLVEASLAQGVYRSG